MKVFISYSVQDINLVHNIDLQIKGISEVFYWDKSKEPGKEVWPTIFGWIDQCDLVIVLITDATVSRAMSVGTETGHAKAKNKLIIPLVSDEVNIEDIGCLRELTCERFNRDNFDEVIKRIRTLIFSKKTILDRNGAIVLCGLALLLALAASNNK